MMPVTNAEIVRRAYRKIGVLAEDMPLTAWQVQAGLEALGDMLRGLELFGVRLSLSSMDGPSDPFPLAAKFHEGAVYQLAARLSPDFSVPAPAADAWLRAMQAATVDVGAVTLDSTLTQMPSQRDRFWSG
jgi:hypothetical protein